MTVADLVAEVLTTVSEDTRHALAEVLNPEAGADGRELDRAAALELLYADPPRFWALYAADLIPKGPLVERAIPTQTREETT